MVSTPEIPIIQLDPNDIRVDAASYQFRLAADARSGVTRQYRYEDKAWDAEKHGRPLIVHQRLNGQYYVADGHHRLEFAKRLGGTGNGPKALSAYVFREADGYSVKDVRLIAAYQNMSRGHSSAVESARIFKEAYAEGRHRDYLPVLLQKPEMQVAAQMSELSDQALASVENGGILPEVAARVAIRLKNPATQEGVLSILAADNQLKSFAERVREREQPSLSRN